MIVLHIDVQVLLLKQEAGHVQLRDLCRREVPQNFSTTVQYQALFELKLATL